MKRPEYRIRKAQVGKWEYWCIWIPAKVAGNSKGSRRYFRTKAEAVAARAAYLNAAAGDTDEAPPDELVADATEARRVLDKAGIKLPLAEVGTGLPQGYCQQPAPGFQLCRAARVSGKLAV